MPQPLIVPLPPNISLWDSCVLRVAALDPTDGSIVTGVTIDNVTIECEVVRGSIGKLTNPLLIGVSA